ncbi:GrpB family protein [Bacillus suaedaesalsae]|uniref:GrpB family protein n=1 Tax=Bacillus suaedaesalsae TaxID=2810349 RepID=A0ABS2DM54_9BACI|nr:GrpB family protein [Bacillus suaedaesalsae]MBM6619568.1 GrpB family protein [Bacillus suaedaesalsae]
MKVRLSEYSENWTLMFQEETEKLRNVFGDEIVTFEHFGSTSVPGLKAKPIIDMMCMVMDIERIDTFNDKMVSLGYDVAGEWGIEGRRLFRKGGENRTHHIHVYQSDHPQIKRHLIFRDYLRSHPEEVQLYSNFKEKLASQFENTSGYSPAKKAFVSEMEKQALEWYNTK